MSESENFLNRWSRRKRVAEKPDQSAPAAAVDPVKPVVDGEPASEPLIARTEQTAAAPEPQFDPATLPPLDSIGAESDITAFLKPGVPSELRLAALRRAWSADPAIANFKGLAENDWDFTVPNSMMGFGEIDPGLDVKKMLAQVFGKAPRADASQTNMPAQQQQLTPPSNELSSPIDHITPEQAEQSANASESSDPQRIAAIDNKGMVQREENIATQDNDIESGDAEIKRRRSQGSALPQ